MVHRPDLVEDAPLASLVRSMKTAHRAASLGAALVFGAGAAGAQTAPAQQPIEPLRMAECAAIGAAADRLACYDQLAGRAPPSRLQPARAKARAIRDSLLARACRCRRRSLAAAAA